MESATILRPILIICLSPIKFVFIFQISTIKQHVRQISETRATSCEPQAVSILLRYLENNKGLI